MLNFPVSLKHGQCRDSCDIRVLFNDRAVMRLGPGYGAGGRGFYFRAIVNKNITLCVCH